MTLVLEIHPSDVNAGMLCPTRLVDDTLRYPSYDLMRGSLAHAIISAELGGAEGIDIYELCAMRYAEDFALNLDDFPYRHALNTLVHEANVAAVEWKRHVRPRINLTGGIIVEEQMISVIDVDEELDIEVDLVGTPDLVDGDGVIHDWKTARRPWEINKPPGQQQPPLYSHLVSQAPMPFMFWIFDFSSGVWVEMDMLMPTQTQLDASLDMARNLAWARYHKCLVANPGQPPAFKTQTRNWWCSPKYCHRWNQCTDKSLVNDGSDEVVADWQTEWKEANAS